MKSKTEVIVTVVFLILIIVSFITDIDNYIPGLTNIFPFIGVFLMIFEIYESNKYLKNKPKNEIRIRSKNDSYLYALPFIIGSIFWLVSIMMFFLYENKIIAVLLFLSGIVLIFKGFMFIPNVIIRKENGNLHLENGKIVETINIDLLEKIILKEENIEFNFIENKKLIFSHLELNPTEIETTKHFLRENTNPQIILI